LSYEERQQTEAALQSFIDKDSTKALLKLDRKMEYMIPSFHPLYRINRAGSIRWDLVVEVVQTADGTPNTYPRRGGTTMIISTNGTGGNGQKQGVFLRYAIPKPVSGDEGERRATRQTAYFEQLGIRKGIKARELHVNFALIHGDT
jgi:hypothetical protein